MILQYKLDVTQGLADHSQFLAIRVMCCEEQNMMTCSVAIQKEELVAMIVGWIKLVMLILLGF